MPTKPLKVHLSYVKGTTVTQKEMKGIAKGLKVDVDFRIHTPYVGHAALIAKGGKRALASFLDSVGLSWGKTFIGEKS